MDTILKHSPRLNLKWTVLFGVLFLHTFAVPLHANHVHMHGGPFIGVVLSAVVDPKDPNQVYIASYGGGVFRTTNAGATWAAISQGLPDRQVYTLLMDPADSNHLYVGTDRGVFHSFNRGNSWKPLTPVLTNRNIRALAVDPTESGLLYVATDQGVFVGRGERWENHSTGLTTHDVRAVVVSPQGRAYAGTFSGAFAKERDSDIWVPINFGLKDVQVRVLALDSSSPTTLYAGTAVGGIFKTTNAGKRWVAANQGMTNKMVLSLAVVKARPSTVYAGTIGGVFKSTNGGSSWMAAGDDVSLTVTTLALDPAGLGLVYAGSGGRLFKSNDAGKKWTEVGHHINHFGPVGPAVH